jgi:hypothetical protein
LVKEHNIPYNTEVSILNEKKCRHDHSSKCKPKPTPPSHHKAQSLSPSPPPTLCESVSPIAATFSCQKSLHCSATPKQTNDAQNELSFPAKPNNIPIPTQQPATEVVPVMKEGILLQFLLFILEFFVYFLPT